MRANTTRIADVKMKKRLVLCGISNHMDVLPKTEIEIRFSDKSEDKSLQIVIDAPQTICL